jgi:hypothetical protein
MVFCPNENPKDINAIIKIAPCFLQSENESVPAYG